MLGAVAAHLFVLQSSPAMPLILLMGLMFVAWARRSQTIGFARRFVGAK